MLAYTWMHAAVVAALPLVGFSSYEKYNYLNGCHMVWSQDTLARVFAIFVGVTTFYPSTLVILVSYIFVFRAALRSAHNGPPGLQTDLSLKTILAKDIRIAKTGVIVIGAFMLSWFPFVGLRASRLYINSPDILAHVKQGEIISLYLFTISNYVNPLVYGIYNGQVRSAIAKLFKETKRNYW